MKRSNFPPIDIANFLTTLILLLRSCAYSDCAGSFCGVHCTYNIQLASAYLTWLWQSVEHIPLHCGALEP